MTLSLGEARASGLAWLLRRLRMDRAEIATGIVFAAVAFLVLYPIGSVVYLTFLPNSMAAVFGTIPWYRAYAEPGMLQSVINTIEVVVAVQAISMPIAIVVSWFLARTDVPFSRTIEFCYWIMFFLPSMGVMTGWLLLFDPDFGLVNQGLMSLGIAKGAVFNLYSFWGIVFVHLTTYGISVKVMLLTPAFRNLDASIEEASYLCGANRWRTLLRIVLPIMTPAILVVLLMSIIRGLETFEIELILGTPIKFQVYSTKLYLLMANSPPEFRAAGTLGTSVLAMVLPLIVLQRWASTRRSYAVVTGRASTARIRLRRWRWPAFLLMAGGVAFMSLLPFLLLVAGSFMKLFGFFNLKQVWTIEHWVTALADSTFTSSLRNMLYLGVGTSVLAIVVYALVAYCAVRAKSRLRGPLDMITWLPYTVPGIVAQFRLPQYGAAGAALCPALRYRRRAHSGEFPGGHAARRAGDQGEHAADGNRDRGSGSHRRRRMDQHLSPHHPADRLADAGRGRHHGVRAHDPQRIEHHAVEHRCQPRALGVAAGIFVRRQPWAGGGGRHGDRTHQPRRGDRRASREPAFRHSGAGGIGHGRSIHPVWARGLRRRPARDDGGRRRGAR